jgi:uncharacterized protein YdaU (DUF1376 family)
VNFYPHHIGDYRSATTHLSNDEDLAYRRLLEMYYDTEQPIPADTQWVSRRLRVGTEHLEAVLKDFFFLSADGYRHTRCDFEIAEYGRKAATARANGSKGGRRKPTAGLEKNPVGSHPVSDGLAKQTQALANQEPLTINQEPLTINQEPIKRDSVKRKIAPELFNVFWSAYPKHVAKKDAIRAFEKLPPGREVLDSILAAIAVQSESLDWQKNGGQYIPHPATWLNARRWEDELRPMSAEPCGFGGAI